MKSATKFSQKHLAIAAGVAVVLSLVVGFSVGKGQGFTEGTADGYLKGDRDGWNRGTKAGVEKAWWDGVIVGCRLVFDTVKWEYIYGNVLLGGETIGKDVYCHDTGDHSNTPTFELPYTLSGTEGGK